MTKLNLHLITTNRDLDTNVHSLIIIFSSMINND